MPQRNGETKTISIRVPVEVYDWVQANGGGDLVKALLIYEWHRIKFPKEREEPYATQSNSFSFQNGVGARQFKTH